MRTLKEFTVDIVRKPPMLLSLIALFHLIWLFGTIWSDRHEPFPDFVWLEVVWLIGYTSFWIAVCDMRRWGAIGYVLLTAINTSMYFAAKYHHPSDPYLYVNNMSFIDVFFSMILLYYYKMFI